MKDRPFRHLSHAAVLASFKKSIAAERENTAELLAYLAEFEARDLHRSRGFDSIEAYCLENFNWDEDEIPMRILVARTGRKFPELFEALASGALHLETIARLAPHLTSENAARLIREAKGKPEPEVTALLEARFPRS